MGRERLRDAGAVPALAALIKALPHPAVLEEMGALKSRIESTKGEDVAAALSAEEERESSRERESRQN